MTTPSGKKRGGKTWKEELRVRGPERLGDKQYRHSDRVTVMVAKEQLVVLEAVRDHLNAQLVRDTPSREERRRRYVNISHVVRVALDAFIESERDGWIQRGWLRPNGQPSRSSKRRLPPPRA